MPNILGTEGNDIFSHAGGGSDTYILIGGADRLTVFAGTVQAFMGEGDDLIDLRGGTTTAYGESGADRFEMLVGATAYGGGGDDIFNIRGGIDATLDGGSGDDRFNFAAAAGTILINGGVGHDNFAGGNFATTGWIYGDGGNDLFTGFRSGVNLYGGTGDDVYRVNPLSNADFVELVGEGNDTVQLMRGLDFYTLPANIERIVVGTYAGSDGSVSTITMNDLDNVFTGHGNTESVLGLGGNDRMFGKSGNDVLNGGDGIDLLDGGAGDDALHGGAGNDRLVGRAGNDTMAGGTGNDTYYVDALGDMVQENIGEGTDLVRASLSYTLSPNVENGLLTGTGDFQMVGNALANRIWGNGGNNTIVSYEGDDTVYAGGGNDAVAGYLGNDVLYGGIGGDALSGEQDDDTLNGESGDDGLSGGSGADTLNGGDDTDSLYGDDGPDVLNGGAGADTLRGGLAADMMTGGTGGDHFVFYLAAESTNLERDTITDFSPGFDVVDLSNIDANTGVAGDQAFAFTGMTATANSLWFGEYVSDGIGGAWVTWFADVNGDTTPEFEIRWHQNTAVSVGTDIVL